jgi:signal transduction histidine kinase/ligand-binding sensor domain-containing protein
MTPGRNAAVGTAAHVIGGLSLLLTAAATAAAQDRLVRTFGQERGLAAPVWALAQDSVGFLWIGAEGGLYRFDGGEFRRWASEAIRDGVNNVAVSPTGAVIAVERNGRAFEITAGGARPFPLPASGRDIDLNQLTFDGGGRLWVVLGQTVWYRSTNSTWNTVPGGALGGERPRRIKANPVRGVDIITPGALWRVEPDEAPRKILSVPAARDVWYYGPDRFVALTNSSNPGEHLIEVDRGVRHELLAPAGLASRTISLAERNGTLWVALDRWLLGTRPGAPLDTLGLSEGINSGGPLLVDREGTLWLGAFTGLAQMPEPDSRTWTDRHGLHTRHARFVAKSEDAVWVATWGGTNVLHWTDSAWSVVRSGSLSQERACTDERGVIWTPAGLGGGVLEARGASIIRRHRRPTGFHACAIARDGGTWMTLRDTLFFADPTRGNIRPVPSPPGDGLRGAILHDRHDRLWLSVGDAICSAPVARVLADERDTWACDPIAPSPLINAIIELPSGTLWAASGRLGVLARKEGRWVPLSTDSLPTRTVFSLARSPRGGIWLIGHGILQRVEEAKGGWKVLERLTRWQGLLTVDGGDLLEEDDGTIWIASAHGVTRVPASARLATAAPPPIALVEARVDDRVVPVDGALRLPHDRNRLELRFAALSFRDPSQVRHQVRLDPREAWSESRSGASFRWVDLRPREYQVEYRASLDGITWSPHPLRFTFSVSSPWYRTPWAMALALGVAGALTWLAYRVRLAHLLGLERQRTRIALDLHDEVGSGLASVGILSGVLAGDVLGAEERRHTAGEIASAAEELGNALSDIVWSLDPHTATLEELASRLAEHGERLSAGGEAEFLTRFPEAWPTAPLDVTVRRNVLLVGLEALHNATRHARARRVTLSLVPDDEAWVLSVRDDGVGLASNAADNGGGGHGLSGMRRRAEEISARLDVRSAEGEGTTVTLRFPLRPRALPRTGLAALLRGTFATRPT